jgi:osmotically-inducible protein OsmY
MPQNHRNRFAPRSGEPADEGGGHAGDRSRSSGGYSGSYYGTDGYGSDAQDAVGGEDSRDFSNSPQFSHRGRGPKGYVRSDERLREIICERLTDDPNIDAREVSIEVTNQVVKVSGSIDNRRSKHEIEELIEGVGGVQGIDNQLLLV